MASTLFLSSTKIYRSHTSAPTVKLNFKRPTAVARISLPRVKQEPHELKIKCNIPLKCHPQLDCIRKEAHAWLRNYVSNTQLEGADLPLLIMSMNYLGDAQAATNLVKFFLFLVPLDDLMDSFPASIDQCVSRRKIVNYIVDVMHGKTSQLYMEEFPLLCAWMDLCDDIRGNTSALQWERFVKGMTTYLQGLDEQGQLQVNPCLAKYYPTLSTYATIRRKVIGAIQAFPLVHAIIGLEIEDELWYNKSFKDLHNYVLDHMVFTNDILSYEEDEGVIWNIVSITQATYKCSLKEAISLSCQKAEDMEKVFTTQFLHFRFRFRDRPLLLAYLNTLAAHMSGHLTWLSRSPKYGTRKCKLILGDGNAPTLQLKYIV